MKKKTILLFLRIVVSAILIGYFLLMLSTQPGGLIDAFKKIFEAFSSASLRYLIPASLLHLVGFALISLRWKFTPLLSKYVTRPLYCSDDFQPHVIGKFDPLGVIKAVCSFYDC